MDSRFASLTTWGAHRAHCPAKPNDYSRPASMPMSPDLTADRASLRAGSTTAAALAEHALAIAQGPSCAGAFLMTMPDAVRGAAADPSRRGRPLAGLPVSVKDLFDIGGQTTAAGS
ncbi:MAG: hypothetical protein EON92_10555, partial [Burkholderiales bacterium]